MLHVSVILFGLSRCLMIFMMQYHSDWVGAHPHEGWTRHESVCTCDAPATTKKARTFLLRE
jgi:hypothetical protein